MTKLHEIYQKINLTKLNKNNVNTFFEYICKLLQIVTEYSKNRLTAKTPPIDLSNASQSSIDNYFSKDGESTDFEDFIEFFLGTFFI